MPAPVDSHRATAEAPAPCAQRRRALDGHSDEQLVRLAERGDPRGFDLIYERYGVAVFVFCRHLVRSQEEAEDVHQEVFLTAFSAIRRGAGPVSLKPWLYRVAHNACMSALRRRRPIAAQLDDVLAALPDTSGPSDVDRETVRELLQNLAKLPPAQRAALLLREMNGLSYEEVARAMDLPLSTVRSLLFRARSTLQRLARASNDDCADVQAELLAVADRRGRRKGALIAHLSLCPACREYRDGLRRRPAELGALASSGDVAAAGT